MEPITYILSLPPIIIPFIVQMTKPNLSLKAWIRSYENTEAYTSARKMMEIYQEKITLQETLVNKLSQELSEL